MLKSLVTLYFASILRIDDLESGRPKIGQGLSSVFFWTMLLVAHTTMATPERRATINPDQIWKDQQISLRYSRPLGEYDIFNVGFFVRTELQTSAKIEHCQPGANSLSPRSPFHYIRYRSSWRGWALLQWSALLKFWLEHQLSSKNQRISFEFLERDTLVNLCKLGLNRKLSSS